MRISSLCAEHPVSVLMIYAGVMFTGILSALHLEINLYPEIEIPEASVICSHPEMNAREMEQLVAIPLENSLSTVRGIKEIKSVSKDGICSVNILLGINTCINSADAEIKEKIDIAYAFLPDKASKPVVFFKNIFETPFMTLGIFPAEGKRPSDICDLVDKEMKTRLLAVEGVAEVRISGSGKKEIVIDIDYPKLINTGISLDEISTSAAGAVFNYPVGIINTDIREFRVKAKTDINNTSDLKEIPAIRDNALRIGDIADIYETEEESNSFFISGSKERIEECIGIEIIKSGYTGLIGTSKRLKKNISKMQDIFRNDFHISIIEDSSVSLSSSLKSLYITIGIGFLSAAAVLLLIFRDFRISAIVFISLPASLSIVFIYMFFLKVSINLISLSGLAIGCGMVFDNSIVILDKLLKTQPASPYLIGKTLRNTVSPAAGSTATTVIVFIPVLLIPGITGKLFYDLALSIIIFIIASFTVSVTLTPSLYMILGLPLNYKERKNFMIVNITVLYYKYLIWIKGKKHLKYLLIPLLTIPFTLTPLIDFKTAPDGSENIVSAQIAFQPGLRIEEYCSRTAVIIRNLLEKGIAVSVNAAGGYDSNSPFEKCSKEKESWITLLSVRGHEDYSGVTEKYADLIENYFRERKINAVIRSRGSFMDRLPRIGSELFEARVVDKNREECGRKVQALSSYLQSIDGDLQITGNFIKNIKGFNITFSNEKLAETGISNMEIFETLTAAVKGRVFQLNNFNGETGKKVRIRFKKEYTDTPFKIASLKFPFEKGLFDISSSASVTAEMNYPYLERINRKPALTVIAAPGKTDKKDLQRLVNESADSSIEIVSASVSRENIIEISVLFLSSLLMLYLFLGAQFESYTIPLFIMMTIPFSVSGSISALLLTGRSFNLSSFLGILILSGTVVNTAIIIFSERTGVCSDIRESVKGGIRAVTASVLTTAAALLSAAFLDKNPVLSNAAFTLLGGLASGTAALFLIFPMTGPDSRKNCGRRDYSGNE